MVDYFVGVDWRALFARDTPLLEIFLRGTITYLALLLLLRLVLKRERGNASLSDLLVLVVLADAAQNALAGGYTSITDGILLVTTILLWSHTINWLGYHNKVIGKLVHPDPLLLVKDGQVQRQNLRKELLTLDELETLLREQEVYDLAEVEEAFMEGDGQLSVRTRERDEPQRKRRKPRENQPGV